MYNIQLDWNNSNCTQKVKLPILHDAYSKKINGQYTVTISSNGEQHNIKLMMTINIEMNMIMLHYPMMIKDDIILNSSASFSSDLSIYSVINVYYY